jgi:hypothetical protein
MLAVLLMPVRCGDESLIVPLVELNTLCNGELLARMITRPVYTVQAGWQADRRKELYNN